MVEKKILVTGGAGYIGSHTCVELINSGYTPIIIDNFSNSEKFILDRLKELTGQEVALEEGDCGDYDFLKSVFKKHADISGVIHFAAYKAVGESAKLPLKYYQNNLLSTINMLKVLDEEGVTNFVFSSSCTVYGEPDKLPVTEETPTKPAESPYGRTKQICEDITTDFAKTSETFKGIFLRYFNPIGAHPTSLIGELPLGTPNNLVPFITQTAAEIREKLTIFGNDYNTADGTCIRDYIHVVDLAKAHIAALDYLLARKDACLEVFNVGTGNGNSVQEVVDTFQEVTGVKLNYEIGARRSGDVEKVYADASKVERELKWKAEITLAEALKDAWNWQKSLG
ncbi:UDP-glucose 4-epimerase GalE [Fulvivirga maritima]|uniref:UDP-glucose 4-epimerase GalE n=1 Tax=Fulvivirga maritima TaxID=2904247 RepID=UPI001F48FD99|nr:UDP-glucose 4-epimerase GalE [Fulvivirga maritima]UII29474.1 UDP-glucose 4-epimerase GalE [Fulvivirga maritima]